MIVDTSAIIAVLKEETGAPRFLRALTISSEPKPKRMSAANYLEGCNRRRRQPPGTAHRLPPTTTAYHHTLLQGLDDSTI